MKLIILFLLPFFTNAATENASSYISNFDGPDKGTIEIGGDIAKELYERMSGVESSKGFESSSKVGAHIRCDSFGMNEQVKQNSSLSKKQMKKISGLHYKCFIKMNEKGEITVPVLSSK